MLFPLMLAKYPPNIMGKNKKKKSVQVFMLGKTINY
jgi:hypothetical protein